MKSVLLTVATLLLLPLATSARAADEAPQRRPAATAGGGAKSAEDGLAAKLSEDAPAAGRTGSGGMYDCGSSLSMKGHHGGKPFEAGTSQPTPSSDQGTGLHGDSEKSGSGETQHAGHM